MATDQYPDTATGEPVGKEPIDKRPAIIALVVGLLAIGAVVALQPSIVAGGAGSARAVGITLAALAVYAGLVLLALRFVRQPWGLAAVVGVPLFAVAGALAVTSLGDDEANDADAEQLAAELAEAEDTPEPATDDPTSDATATDDATDDAAATEAPTAPVRLGTGDFVGLDDHSAAGTASLVEQPDGSRVVLFEGFEVERGPDFLVYLVPGTDAFDYSQGVEIGPLQGNVGDQQYAVPDELADTQPLTVLVWCRAFDVNIAGATV